MLRAYQEEGATRLAAVDRMILGDPIGLGKTRTVLRAAQLAGLDYVVVLCPAIVREHWHREAAIVAPKLRLTVVSYAKVALQSAVSLGLQAPEALVLDEFHYLKHRESKRTQLVLGPGGLVEQMLSTATGRVWCVSGTPMPRNPSELFPVLWAMWREDLRTRFHINGWWDWVRRYCAWKPTQHGIKVYGARNVPELKLLLLGKMIRRRSPASLPRMRLGVLTLAAGDLGALPALDPATAALLASGQLPVLDDNLARHRHAVGDLKAPLVAQILRDELEDDKEKRVVFCYHRSVLDTLERELKPFGVARIDGSTPDSTRQRVIKEFREYPNVRVFLGQIGACGTGMDGLQYAAHECIIAEPSWNSDENVQAIGRLSRLGQTRPVQARFIALADTADEAVVRQHERESAMRLAVTP
jgi:hypothetical protein